MAEAYQKNKAMRTQFGLFFQGNDTLNRRD